MKIKLVIVDYYGVMTKGSYKETCEWIAKKYKMKFKYVYNVVYFKYFTAATLGKITERQSFDLAAKELGLEENWKELREKHLSFQKINTPVFNLVRKLQKQGYKILLLSKNTPQQFDWTLKKLNTRRYFKNIINTHSLKLPKGSRKTIRYVLKKFKINPEETIMIDDQSFNLENAEKLGVYTIFYKDFKSMKKRIIELIL